MTSLNHKLYKTLLVNLKTATSELRNENAGLKQDNEALIERIINMETSIDEHEKHLNGIEQYLRVNNIEIVGLPEAEVPGAPVEKTIIEILNTLPDLVTPIKSEDIDICHVIPSDRRDKKIVAVCKFVSRKTKLEILEAKKKSRDFKFKENNIFINEHLSPFNRKLFAAASTKKKELNYRFLWNRQGMIFMRKGEKSPIIKIDSEDALNNLPVNFSEDN